MNLLHHIIALVLIPLLVTIDLPAQTLKGNIRVSGNLHIGGNPQTVLFLAAARPTSWVNSGLISGNGFCSTTFDATKTLKNSGGDYAATFAAMQQAKTDQANAHQNWLLVVDTNVNLHGSSFNADNALLSWPVTTYEAGKCLTVRSSTHNTNGQSVCGQVYPTIRDLNCVSDATKFWKFTVDSVPVNGDIGMLWPTGSNNIIVEDGEFTVAPGASQSKSGVKVSILGSLQGDHIGFAYNWVHGWNPGDSGQPAGNCSLWTKSSVVNTSGTTVTWVSGERFGMEVADATHSTGWTQATVNIASTNYTVTNHDPTTSDTTFTINTSAGVQTNVSMSFTNPRTGYTPGCGDDVRGFQFNCATCFVMYNQINKIHWFASESHALGGGFSAGPVKIVGNYIEAGSSGIFTGGAAVDILGGPLQDFEVGNNYIGRDLDWRYLSAAASNSPSPPYGCGPFDGSSVNDTCTFNWGIKNLLEMKECNRCVVYGNILDGNWADGQSGYAILLTPRSISGGSSAGIYYPSTDPLAGLPMTVLQNVAFENDWVRNTPQIVQISSRALIPGDGGGISAPVANLDFINILATNVQDHAQFGTPGNDIFQWAASGQKFTAMVSRAANVAHAVLSPIKLASYVYGAHNVAVADTAFDISSVIRSGGNSVTMKMGAQRHDPTVGGQVVVTGASGWNGTFTITDVKNSGLTTRCTQDNDGNTVAAADATQPQPCVRNNGTFGEEIVYTDGQGGNATLCSTTITCTATGIQAIADTLAYNISDIAIGDGVYAYNCSDSSFNSGTTSLNPALSPTSPTGLNVYYASVGSNASGVTCTIENSAGLPRNTTYQNVTILANSIMSINSNGISGQHLLNKFYNNLFGMPSGNNAVLTDPDVGGQGTSVYAAFDATTFQWYGNVMQGRTSSQWSVVPGGGAINSFPTNVTCSGATADPTCVGFSGYMSGVTFPTTDCPDANAPLNCPLMAAPWSNNFTLSKLQMVGSSSYIGSGVNVTNLENAFTATQYTCPDGANCGVTGPYPD